MPFRSCLLTVDIMEKAARYFLLLQVFPDTEAASLIMIDGMTWTFVIGAGTEFLCLFHCDAPIHVSLSVNRQDP